MGLVFWGRGGILVPSSTGNHVTRGLEGLALLNCSQKHGSEEFSVNSEPYRDRLWEEKATFFKPPQFLLSPGSLSCLCPPSLVGPLLLLTDPIIQHLSMSCLTLHVVLWSCLCHHFLRSGDRDPSFLLPSRCLQES